MSDSKQEAAESVSNDLLQIINFTGDFVEEAKFSKCLKDKSVYEKGLSYFVVAIMGCQSSGKSTLLNSLFGTRFPVMDAAMGRTQTTQGIWMGVAKTKGEEENILVFDVEGVDGVERAEDAFERKTSLFSLVLSQVLVVNIWQHDIGRYTAGNVALLKVVFELNLQLFAKKQGNRTLLLFVVRDYSPKTTPLEKLKETVLNEIHQKIWKNIIKPKDFENSKVEDFFEFDFVGLYSKIEKEEEFETQTKALRDRFFDPKNPTFVLKDQSPERDIPADGLPKFAENIWAVVRENKDLNVPSEKEMLSIYRCDQISDEAYKQFLGDIKEWQSMESVVPKLGEKGSELIAKYIEQYNGPASRYTKKIADEKRAALEAKMSKDLADIFTKQMDIILTQAFAMLKSQLKSNFSGSIAVENFSELKAKIIDSVTGFFNENSEQSKLPNAGWTIQKETGKLNQEIKESFEKTRNDQMHKLVSQAKSDVRDQLNVALDKKFERTTPTFWADARSAMETIKGKVGAKYFEALENFECDEAEKEEKKLEFNDTVLKTLREKFQEKAKFATILMNKKFNNAFKYDSSKGEGVPRYWNPEDNVAEVFQAAREEGKKVLELFIVLRLDAELDNIEFLKEDNYDKLEEPKYKELKILSRDEASVLLEKYDSDCKDAFSQAKREQDNLKTTFKIPFYMFVVTAVLGWNEFMTVISNPLATVFFLLLGAIVFVLYKLGMLVPAIVMLEAKLRELWEHVLHQHNQQQQQKDKRKEKDE